MSYDIAVWEGDRPTDDQNAGSTYDELYQRYLESEENEEPPNPRIKAYVDALLERYPDDAEDGVWSVSQDDGSGPIVYLTVLYSRAEEVSEYAGELATRHGLVCFDVQTGRVLSS
jgi:hypothetical protein